MRKISHSQNRCCTVGIVYCKLYCTKRAIEFRCMPISIVYSKILNRDSDGRSELTLNVHCDAVNYSRFNNNVLCMQKGQEKFVGLVAEFLFLLLLMLKKAKGSNIKCWKKTYCSSIGWNDQRRRKRREKRCTNIHKPHSQIVICSRSWSWSFCVFVPHFIFIGSHRVYGHRYRP